MQSELTEAKIKYSKVEEKLKKTENSLQSVQEQFKTKLQDFALKLKTSTSTLVLYKLLYSIIVNDTFDSKLYFVQARPLKMKCKSDRRNVRLKN